MANDQNIPLKAAIVIFQHHIPFSITIAKYDSYSATKYSDYFNNGVIRKPDDPSPK
jgi:hypothetical protein